MTTITIPKFNYSSIEIPDFTIPDTYVAGYYDVLSRPDFTSFLDYHDVNKLIETNLRNNKIKEDIILHLKNNFTIILNTGNFKPKLSGIVIFVKLGSREITGLRIAWVEHILKHLK